jgi:glyoxylase-like metal-dependent hydrolase (beta-lactamase superfamily II)
MVLKIADHWFERKRIDAHITQLWEPHVHPLLRCNIWHVCGRDRDLLVDTGLGIASLRDAIADLLDRPLDAVATHIHYDHVGGLHEFESRIMHKAEAAQLLAYKEFASLKTDDFGPFIELLADAGYTVDGDLLIDALPHDAYDPASYVVTPTSATKTLDEGDTIDLGDRYFEILHLPGHSHGSIGLWDAASGVLFSGDAIYDGPLIDVLPESDIEVYIRTMKRLRELPVSAVHAGHEPSFGRERLIDMADRYLARRDA